MREKNVRINPMGCIVYPYKPNESRNLERGKSTWDPVYRKSHAYTGFYLPYKGKTAYITHNHPYDKLVNWFSDSELTIDRLEVLAGRPMKKKLKFGGIKEFKSSQSNILGQIDLNSKKDTRWFINLQTGQGKTILSTYLMSMINRKAWILCFSTDILAQWLNAIINHLSISPDRILNVKSGAMLKKLMTGKLSVDDYDIFLCTPGLLTNYAEKENDFSAIETLFKKCGIGTFIYDEAHRNVSNLVKITAVANVKYQLYLSAELGQGDYRKEKMYLDLFSNISILKLDESINNSLKYTKVVVVDFDTKPRGAEELQIFDKYGYDAQLYMQYEFKRGVLLEAIMYILETIYRTETKHRILILFNNIEHVDLFTDYLTQELPKIKSGVTIGKFHSGVSKDVKSWVKDHANIIISTYKSFSTGLDTDGIKYVLSTDQCNKIADNQSAGRARPLADGSDAMYFMFIDNGFSYCRRKLKIRLNYLIDTKSNSAKPFLYHFYPKDYTI